MKNELLATKSDLVCLWQCQPKRKGKEKKMKKAIKALGIITLMTIGTTAWGGYVEGAEAEKIIVKGEIVYADREYISIIYKGKFYECKIWAFPNDLACFYMD